MNDKILKIINDKIIFSKDSRVLENPKYLQKNVFLLYSPRKFTIEPATSKKIDTEVTAFCQKIPGGKLHRNLELMKLMNLFMESTAYGSNYETNLLKIIS